MVKIYLIFLVLLTKESFGQNDSDDTECAFEDHEANCYIDIMEEQIEATAIVEDCKNPVDITFHVTYRYGNSTEKRWQYTYQTTDQNVRVLIPGLFLPPADDALVYLYVRIIQPYKTSRNLTDLSVEASFVAVLGPDKWEEVEFLNDLLPLKSKEECQEAKRHKVLLWIIVGSMMFLGVVIVVAIAVLIIYRRRKRALDQLALVHNLDVGLPGAKPYQIGGPNSSSSSPSNEAEVIENTQVNWNPSLSFKESKSPGFKFEKLEEEPAPVDRSKLTNAVIIGNPVFFEMESMKERKDLQASSVTNNMSKATNKALNKHIASKSNLKSLNYDSKQTDIIRSAKRKQSAP